MKAYGKEIDDAVSIGLGAGDNRQAAVVAEIAKHYPGSHINQVFLQLERHVQILAKKIAGLIV